MASIKIQGDTSGEITIAAPAVAGTNTITLPASSGTMVTSDNVGTYAVTPSNISNYASSFFSESVTFSTNTTVTSANNGKVYYTSTSDLILTLPAPAGGTDVLSYGIINDSNTDLIIKTNNTATEYIGPHLGSAIIASKEEGIIVSIGSNWKFIATTATPAINLVQFTSSGTYTPDSTVSAFLVCLGGSCCSTDGNTYGSAGGAGGSYGEKLYSSPSGSYTVTLGAGGTGVQAQLNAGASSNFNSQLVVGGSSTGGSAGTVTGADYSSTGGSAGGSNRPGGGGGAGRAGNGGNGANTGGGGGGSGGNNASGTTGGVAATSQAAGVYNLSALFTSFTFYAGSNGNGSTQGGNGAYGRQSITDLAGNSAIIYGGGRGTRCTSSAISGDSATCTIIEFKG